MSGSAYVISSGTFLPNAAVSNDQMEDVLGLVRDKRSLYRQRVLSMNGIHQRHYAIGADGKQNFLNHDLMAHAMHQALQGSGVNSTEIGMLAAATSLPDIFAPGFASMVHGRLAELDASIPPLEILTAHGVCTAGTQAFRGAVNTVRLGDHHFALAGASELVSPLMRGQRFEVESVVNAKGSDLKTAFKFFNADFLRWMLSDGAGAVMLSSKPHPERLSLRVDWVESLSFANEAPVCMFMGASDPRDISAGNTWLGKDSMAQALEDGLMVLRQDTALLQEQLFVKAEAMAQRLIKRGVIDPDARYDWLLPHLSSHVFLDPLRDLFERVGIRTVAPDRWFTNLATVGNVGSASIYLMIDAALKQGLFQPGQRVLGVVPESGRFAYTAIQFTVTSPEQC